MGADLPDAPGASVARMRGRRTVVVVNIRAASCRVCARDMRADRESRRRADAVSTSADDDVRHATDDVERRRSNVPTRRHPITNDDDPTRWGLRMPQARRRHSHPTGWVLWVALLASAIAACGAPGPSEAAAIDTQRPIFVIPDGISTVQTADGVIGRTIAAIQADELALGRDLGPIRVLRAELVPAGQMIPTTRLDGSNPGAGGLGPSATSGWVVEAMGTFLYQDWRDPTHQDVGRHGFYLWADDGETGRAMFTCWSSVPGHVLEETCDGQPRP